jgi:hypothetical protein
MDRQAIITLPVNRKIEIEGAGHYQGLYVAAP